MARMRALAAGLCAAAAALGAAAPAAAQQRVYDAEGIAATAWADCDGGDYALAAVDAAPESAARALEPHAGDILRAAAAWLDSRCGGATETVTVVAVVDAAPVHAVAAARARGWAPGSAPPDARALAFLAPALPDSGGDCPAPDGMAAAGGGAGALRTRLFTAKVARTTGQWSRRQTLEKLVPLHREAMELFARRGFAWACPGAFAAAVLAVQADRARAESLRENLPDLLELAPAELAEAAFGGPDPAPVSDLRALVADTADGPAIRTGGFAYPIVLRLRAAAGLE